MAEDKATAERLAAQKADDLRTLRENATAAAKVKEEKESVVREQQERAARQKAEAERKARDEAEARRKAQTVREETEVVGATHKAKGTSPQRIAKPPTPSLLASLPFWPRIIVFVCLANFLLVPAGSGVADNGGLLLSHLFFNLLFSAFLGAMLLGSIAQFKLPKYVALFCLPGLLYGFIFSGVYRNITGLPNKPRGPASAWYAVETIVVILVETIVATLATVYVAHVQKQQGRIRRNLGRSA